MQKITPFFWFNDNAEEAVNFYTSIFKNSKIGAIARYGAEGAEIGGRKEGSVMTVEFELEGQQFTALNGGPMFGFSPAVSFFVSCDTEEEIDTLWKKLSDGGMVMMEFQAYPFSKKYGWLNDKFGVSWQLNLAPYSQKITPCLMFVGDKAGKAEEAMKMYTGLFENSEIEMIARYEAGEHDVEGYVKHAKFSLDGNKFMAMDSSGPHKFSFTQAISFIIGCDTQKQVDTFWDKLGEGGEYQQCGWLQDKYGVVWQVIPTILGTLVSDPDPAKSQRVMHAMFQMVKLDIATLQKAYDGK